MIRALRLDPTLYREVAEPGGGTWQAVVVVVIAAAISGLSWGTSVLENLVGSHAVGSDLGAAVVQSSVPAAWSSALAQVLAWPIWAAGFWIIGTRWAPPDRPTPWFGQIARPLAFAQAPAVFLMLYVLVVAVVGVVRGPEGIRSGVLWITTFWLFVLLGAWVLAGTFLAVREALGLSNAQTLVALVTVGLAIGALLGIVVLVLSGLAGREFVGLKDNYDPGFTDDGPSALDIAVGLDFNLRFVGLSSTVLDVLSQSVLHPFTE